MTRFEGRIPGIALALKTVAGPRRRTSTHKLKPGSYEIVASFQPNEWPLVLGVCAEMSGPVTERTLHNLDGGVSGYTQRVNVSFIKGRLQVGTPQCALQILTVSKTGKGVLWDVTLACNNSGQPQMICTPFRFNCIIGRKGCLDCTALESRWPSLAVLLHDALDDKDLRDFHSRRAHRDRSPAQLALAA